MSVFCYGKLLRGMTSEPSFQYHFTDLRFELLLLLLLFSV